MAYSIVPVPKSDSTTRLCLDRRRSNTVIIHERYVIPKLEDILTELHNVTVFSKLDLRDGYHQILLNPDSRHITAFATHNGVFQYKQLIYGINLTFELFQPQIEQVMSGCNGVKNISDDMTIWEKDQQKHDENLRKLLQRLEKHRLKLNPKKCIFGAVQDLLQVTSYYQMVLPQITKR